MLSQMGTFFSWDPSICRLYEQQTIEVKKTKKNKGDASWRTGIDKMSPMSYCDKVSRKNYTWEQEDLTEPQSSRGTEQ